MLTEPNEPANQLTKREFIASQALAGLVADGVAKKDIADFAVLVADQLIDALNAGQP